MVYSPGTKNELTDWLSRTEFDYTFGLKSEVESREAFAGMKTQLDLSMKLFQKRNAQFLLKIDFTEFNLDDHNDDQIKAKITVGV